MVVWISRATISAHILPRHFEASWNFGGGNTFDEWALSVGQGSPVAVMYLVLNVRKLILKLTKGFRVREGISLRIPMVRVRCARIFLSVASPSRHVLLDYSVTLLPTSGHPRNSIRCLMVLIFFWVGFDKLSCLLSSPSLPRSGPSRVTFGPGISFFRVPLLATAIHNIYYPGYVLGQGIQPASDRSDDRIFGLWVELLWRLV